MNREPKLKEQRSSPSYRNEKREDEEGTPDANEGPLPGSQLPPIYAKKPIQHAKSQFEKAKSPNTSQDGEENKSQKSSTNHAPEESRDQQGSVKEEEKNEIMEPGKLFEKPDYTGDKLFKDYESELKDFELYRLLSSPCARYTLCIFVNSCGRPPFPTKSLLVDNKTIKVIHRFNNFEKASFIPCTSFLSGYILGSELEGMEFGLQPNSNLPEKANADLLVVKPEARYLVAFDIRTGLFLHATVAEAYTPEVFEVQKTEGQAAGKQEPVNRSSHSKTRHFACYLSSKIVQISASDYSIKDTIGLLSGPLTLIYGNVLTWKGTILFYPKFQEEEGKGADKRNIEEEEEEEEEEGSDNRTEIEEIDIEDYYKESDPDDYAQYQTYGTKEIDQLSPEMDDQFERQQGESDRNRLPGFAPPKKEYLIMPLREDQKERQSKKNLIINTSPGDHHLELDIKGLDGTFKEGTELTLFPVRGGTQFVVFGKEKGASGNYVMLTFKTLLRNKIIQKDVLVQRKHNKDEVSLILTLIKDNNFWPLTPQIANANTAAIDAAFSDPLTTAFSKFPSFLTFDISKFGKKSQIEHSDLSTQMIKHFVLLKMTVNNTKPNELVILDKNTSFVRVFGKHSDCAIIVNKNKVQLMIRNRSQATKLAHSDFKDLFYEFDSKEDIKQVLLTPNLRQLWLKTSEGLSIYQLNIVNSPQVVFERLLPFEAQNRRDTKYQVFLAGNFELYDIDEGTTSITRKLMLKNACTNGQIVMDFEKVFPKDSERKDYNIIQFFVRPKISDPNREPSYQDPNDDYVVLFIMLQAKQDPTDTTLYKLDTMLQSLYFLDNFIHGIGCQKALKLKNFSTNKALMANSAMSVNLQADPFALNFIDLGNETMTLELKNRDIQWMYNEKDGTLTDKNPWIESKLYQKDVGEKLNGNIRLAHVAEYGGFSYSMVPSKPPTANLFTYQFKMYQHIRSEQKEMCCLYRFRRSNNAFSLDIPESRNSDLQQINREVELVASPVLSADCETLYYIDTNSQLKFIEISSTIDYNLLWSTIHALPKKKQNSVGHKEIEDMFKNGLYDGVLLDLDIQESEYFVDLFTQKGYSKPGSNRNKDPQIYPDYLCLVYYSAKMLHIHVFDSLTKRLLYHFKDAVPKIPPNNKEEIWQRASRIGEDYLHIVYFNSNTMQRIEVHHDFRVKTKGPNLTSLRVFQYLADIYKSKKGKSRANEIIRVTQSILSLSRYNCEAFLLLEPLKEMEKMTLIETLIDNCSPETVVTRLNLFNIGKSDKQIQAEEDLAKSNMKKEGIKEQLDENKSKLLERNIEKTFLERIKRIVETDSKDNYMVLGYGNDALLEAQRHVFQDHTDWLKEDANRDIFRMIVHVNTGETICCQLDDEEARTFPFRVECGTRNELDRLKKELENKAAENYTTYEVYRSLVKLDLRAGSSASTEFFKAINALEDNDLKGMMMPLIYTMWNNIFWYTVVLTALYLAMTACVYMYFGLYPGCYPLGVTVCCFNGFWIFYELKSAYGQGYGYYYQSIWNWVDIPVQVFSLAIGIILFGGADPSTKSIGWLRFFTIGFIYFRAVSWFRLLKPTRYLITMMYQVFKDMRSFFAVFIACIVGFTMLWLISPYLAPPLDGQDSPLILSYYDAFFATVYMIFGQVPAVEPSTKNEFGGIRFVILCGFFLVQNLVFLNFLIAFINGTHDSVAEEKDLHDAKELLDLVQDFNSFLHGLTFIGKKQCEFSYFTLMPQAEKQERAEEIAQVKKEIRETKDPIMNKLEEILRSNEQLKTTFEKLEQKVDKLEKAVHPLSKKDFRPRFMGGANKAKERAAHANDHSM